MHNATTQRRLLSAKELQGMGFSRGTAYALLNRADLPVIRIGDRKYMHAELFEAWLRRQAGADEDRTRGE